jgi:hypothetical protein
MTLAEEWSVCHEERGAMTLAKRIGRKEGKCQKKFILLRNC